VFYIIARGLREDRHEFEWAEKTRCPNLIQGRSNAWRFAMHTSAPTEHRFREMADAAIQSGCISSTIADHSKRVTVAGDIESNGVCNSGGISLTTLRPEYERTTCDVTACGRGTSGL